MRQLTQNVRGELNSNVFFYVIFALFLLGAVWIATTSLYPMAFDEEFHYGLIKIYATSWLPYGIEHTLDMAQFGPATADPSYLFHYLMSFPYRLLHLIGLPDIGTIIVLRLINLGFVAGSIVLFRQSFVKAGLSRMTTNLSMLFFMLIPVLYMLGAQINYDSLLLLLFAWCLLLTVTITNQLTEKGTFSPLYTWLLIIAVLLGMSVKYAFLPLALGLFIWLIILAFKNKRLFKHSYVSQLKQFWQATMELSTKIKLGLGALGIVALFFAAHYVTNYVQYGSSIPACDDVFDEQSCTAYGPWNRNTNYKSSLSDSFEPLPYTAYMAVYWLPHMTERLTFALAGKTNGFQTKPPLPITVILFVTLTIIGSSCLALRFIRSRFSVPPFIWLTLLISMVYVAVLSYQLYGDYVETGQPVAINGRYLLPLLPALGAILIESTLLVMQRMPYKTKVFVLIAILVLFSVGGGGVATYIVQSEPHWFWPGWGQSSQAVLQPVFNFITVDWQF